MKTKITLALVIAIAMTSCSKLWYWNDDDKKEEIKLTESNYVFEGDLYKYALEIRIDSLEDRAAYLKEIIGNNQGTPDIEKDFEETTANLANTAEIAEGIVVFEDLADRLGRRNPIGPRPPRPGVIPIDLEYIIVYNLEDVNLQINDENGAELAQSEGILYEIVGTNNMLMYKKVNITNAISEGAVIKIKRLNKLNQSDSYSIQALK
ncbi:MAG: hypothetical protein CML05_03210 [Pseudozobellia sp.]|nr:hypothetical protein [Pseudozobellia sp.]|tara:strand:- start:223 stop:843 length:621 start_codon:yes stop_codon:yes gene_type:complete